MQVKSDKGETTSISLDKQGNVVDYNKDTKNTSIGSKPIRPVKESISLAKVHKRLQPMASAYC
ncbi:hypothetical protein P364_0104435 [Paenibacillus sp. MAEPY2]|nr:hypothetical protein P363_0130870 [Paenibacillus sp. MAEPY1]KGP84658.1 hypothetical protein P364_0104435 [Paenibacillus sp. MAEPY2]